MGQPWDEAFRTLLRDLLRFVSWQEALAPGETLPFRSRLASPPGEGRDVTVRFFTRLDAVAGLR